LSRVLLADEEGKVTRETKGIRGYLDLMHHVLLGLMAYHYQAVVGDRQRYAQQVASIALRERTIH
jgi:hypothetical protein